MLKFSKVRIYPVGEFALCKAVDRVTQRTYNRCPLSHKAGPTFLRSNSRYFTTPNQLS